MSFLVFNGAWVPVLDLQRPRLPIIRSQPLQELYTHAGGSVCDFSGFSERILSIEHARVVCTLPAGHPVDTPQGDLDQATEKRGDLYLAHILHISIASHRPEIVFR